MWHNKPNSGGRCGNRASLELKSVPPSGLNLLHEPLLSERVTYHRNSCGRRWGHGANTQNIRATPGWDACVVRTTRECASLTTAKAEVLLLCALMERNESSLIAAARGCALCEAHLRAPLPMLSLSQAYGAKNYESIAVLSISQRDGRFQYLGFESTAGWALLRTGRCPVTTLCRFSMLATLECAALAFGAPAIKMPKPETVTLISYSVSPDERSAPERILQLFSLPAWSITVSAEVGCESDSSTIVRSDPQMPGLAYRLIWFRPAPKRIFSARKLIPLRAERQLSPTLNNGVPRGRAVSYTHLTLPTKA